MDNIKIVYPHPKGWATECVTPDARDAVQAKAQEVLDLVAQLEAACAALEAQAWDLGGDAALQYLASEVPDFEALRAEATRLRDNADDFETAEEREERHADRYFTPEEAEEYECGIAERRAEDRYNDDFYYGGRRGY